MAASTDEALKILDQSYKDILVQIGKHFKIIAKDGPDALAGTNNAIHTKAADSLAQYHLALSEISSEITRAKSVLLRDLEKLRAARAPPPVQATGPTPVPTPVPVPVPAIGQHPSAPPAPMMELPSAAAHSHSLNAAPYPPGMETKPVAPFPDMGMGMGMSIPGDIADLPSSGKKPSPRVQHGSVKPSPRPAPSTVIKPSPKPAHRPTPPAKVTPVPPPQIPRQAFQAQNPVNQPKSQTAIQPPRIPQSIQPPQQPPTARMGQDPAPGGLAVPPGPGKAGDGTNNGSGNNELTFTEMEFSPLVPPPGESQGAPPAPMPEFDLAGFISDGGTNKPATPGNAGNIGGPSAANMQNNSNNKTQSQITNSNMDDLFNLGDANGGGDNIFDLGGGEVNDSTFDDMMMYFGNNNDSDTAQFEDAYLAL
ncbi:hypothetical protein GGS20DRAFT_555907 [Poronia punctata]|nr:hypothetical protein GGS20DRAFT_555907 [Poronia punctata]